MREKLCYCGNVHAGANLSEVLQSISRGPAKVKSALNETQLSYGLWLSAQALAESIGEQHSRLREALQSAGLDVWTMNAFPFGNFHAKATKFEVYSPNWLTAERQEYSLECAHLLALLLPEGQSGTLSTLPLGYRSAFEQEDQVDQACDRLCQSARRLAELAARSAKSIRLCLEPEPGCALENGEDFIAFWQGPLARAAERSGTREAVEQHLGLCLDTCHHALAFEDAKALLHSLARAEIPIGKIQLSSAIRLDPRDPEAWRAMKDLDEARFLHQVRSRDSDGRISGCDDLDQVHSLPKSSEWRVHFHVPIHKATFGPLQTTQDFMNAVLAELPALDLAPPLEVETYTWHVLPEAMRPKNDDELAECIASELRYAREQIS